MIFRKKAYVLAAGGTGGHLFPALSLAKELKKRGNLVFLFTDERAAQWVNAEYLDGVMVSRFSCAPGKARKIKFFYRLFVCGMKCFFLFLRKRPLVAVGFGGYPSAPPIFAAQILRIPTVLHEGNTVLGRANVVLAKRTKCVATGFAEVISMDSINKSKQFFSGNPIRTEIEELYDNKYIAPQKDDAFNILVIGGSQGARIITEAVPRAVEQLSPSNIRRLNIKQQIQKESTQEVEDVYKKLNIQFEVATFFHDMRSALDWAHLVISRGGAMSLAEIMVAGRPSIIIPLSKTRDGDQAFNAQYYEDKGAAIVVAEENLFTYLSCVIEEIMNSPEKLLCMSKRAKELAVPNASVLLAEKVVSIPNKN
jgi:UDP-N-acetylglucosamine--N-acetylmuramyl-(pentapeptide) pyrophosphoryl-undecaprenol N-acetylglucosamine transferase